VKGEAGRKSEDFSAVRQHYTITGNGFLIVYSVTSKASFLEVDTIYQDILRIKDSDKVPVVIVGNKCDLQEYRQVSRTEGEEYCAKFNLPFFEVSAKERVNVDEGFHAVVKEIINQDKANSKNAVPRSSKKKICVVM